MSEYVLSRLLGFLTVAVGICSGILLRKGAEYHARKEEIPDPATEFPDGKTDEK